MIVVADTSPICYLILIDEVELLAELFGVVCIPEAVASELRHPAVPAPVAEFLAAPPQWLEIRGVGREEASSQVMALDEGERAAILLAQGIEADLVILDDRAAREAARSAGLKVTGTLGILEAGARRGRVDLRAAVKRLRKTNFRASPALLAEVLERHHRS